MTAVTAQRPRRYAAVFSGFPLVALSGTVGVVLMAVAYHMASVSDSSAAYVWFWCGMLVGAVPPATLLVWTTPSAALRRSSLLILAVITYVPKVFRDASGPALFDEVLHYGQILKIAAIGSLAVPNSLVPVLQYYPGADAAVVGLHDVTRLPLWDAGLVLAGLAHLALLAGVYVLAQVVTGRPQLAGLAAVIYAASPGFTFFSTQVAYESIALPIAVWTLVAVLFAVHTTGRRRLWLGLAAAAGIMATGVTHHITSMLLAALLVGLVLTHLAFRDDSAHRSATIATLSGFASFAVAFDVLWIGLHSWHIVTYVSPDPGGALRAAQNLLHLSGHTAFAASSLPRYEQIAGLLAAPIVSVLVLLGVLSHRSIGTSRPLRYSMLAIAVGFPLSLPLEFTNTGLVWAHRLWPYLYIGVAIVAAAAIIRLTEGKPLPGRARWRALTAGISMALVAGLFSLVLIGDTATEVNAQTQFPNQHIYAGAASLDSPAERDVAAWFTAHTAADTRFVSEPDVAVDIISYTNAQAVSKFQTWLLTESTGTVAASVLAQLATAHIAYLVVDTRMYTQIPVRGYIYQPYEPGAFSERHPVPVAAWDALQHRQWARQIFTAGTLTVFHLMPQAPNRGAVSTNTGSAVK